MAQSERRAHSRSFDKLRRQIDADALSEGLPMCPRPSPPQWTWVDQLNAYEKSGLCRNFVDPTLGIEPRNPSSRVAPDRACGGLPASTEASTVPQSPRFLMGMLASSQNV